MSGMAISGAPACWRDSHLPLVEMVAVGGADDAVDHDTVDG